MVVIKLPFYGHFILQFIYCLSFFNLLLCFIAFIAMVLSKLPWMRLKTDYKCNKARHDGSLCGAAAWHREGPGFGSRHLEFRFMHQKRPAAGSCQGRPISSPISSITSWPSHTSKAGRQQPIVVLPTHPTGSHGGSPHIAPRGRMEVPSIHPLS